jgi:hypothetical protein
MDKKIMFTATVYPRMDDNLPTVIVTCAPEGELPSVFSGFFADLHRLMDQAWIEVNTRKPLVVKSATKKVGKVEVGETEHPEGEGEAGDPARIEGDQVEKGDKEAGDGDAA